jgi:heme/copper-type cytochrome/quinol oxidase subunit 1
MSLRDYLHEKAEESRHNETLGFLILLIGVVTLMTGLLITAIKVESPTWFLFVPYELNTHPYSLLALSLTLIGLTLSILGMGFSTHSALQRTMYIDRLKEAQQRFEVRVAEHEMESEEQPEIQVEPLQRRQKR